MASRHLAVLELVLQQSGWGNALQAGQVPDVSPRLRQWLTLCIRLELMLLLIIPLLAMLMARGYGTLGQ